MTQRLLPLVLTFLAFKNNNWACWLTMLATLASQMTKRDTMQGAGQPSGVIWDSVSFPRTHGQEEDRTTNREISGQQALPP